MRVVVFSCDKYSWLIPIFLHFYRKNWPDNSYQTEFVTETKKVEGISTFCAGNISWSSIAIKYLKSINDEIFLLLLDDYIINKKVDTNEVKRAEDLCVGDIGCIGLSAHGESGKFLFDTGMRGFKDFPLGKTYSVSLQAAIWQRQFFLNMLQENESAWQTEINGSKRIGKFNKRVIWTDIPILGYYKGGYMKKGKVVKSVEQWTKENW